MSAAASPCDRPCPRLPRIEPSLLWTRRNLPSSALPHLLSQANKRIASPHPAPNPQTHGEELHHVADLELSELLPAAKKLAIAVRAVEYNILENNGRGADQIVDHVYVHIIPKPNAKDGLGAGWPAQATDMDRLNVLFEELKAKI